MTVHLALSVPCPILSTLSSMDSVNVASLSVKLTLGNYQACIYHPDKFAKIPIA